MRGTLCARRTLLGLLMLALPGGALALADPPINSSQGTQLHGTGRFEHVNIPLSEVELPPGYVAAPAHQPALELNTASRSSTLGISGIAGRASSIAQNPCVYRPLTGRFNPSNGHELEVVPPCSEVLVGERLAETSFYASFEGRTVKLTIKEVKRTKGGGPTWSYRVEWELDGEHGSLCQTGSGWAFAVPHAWSASGELIYNPEYFTFACAPDDMTKLGGGAVAKCIQWGYPPWDVSEKQVDLNGRPVANVEPQDDSVPLRFHQTCVRMATADYCGEGNVNTIDGTPINGFELGNAPWKGEKLPSENNGFLLEAVWGLDSCGKVRPLCLSKKRWEDLALAATCLDRFKPLPWLDLNKPCEPMTKAQLKLHRALLVSYSTRIDKMLVTFSHTGGKGFLTTTSGSAGGTPLHRRYSARSPNFEMLRTEGLVFSDMVSEQLKSALGLKALYQCKSSDGRYLLTDTNTCAEGYTPDAGKPGSIEGYIFEGVQAVGSTEPRPLVLWRNTNDGNYLTTTFPPGDEAFEEVRTLGYLPAEGVLATPRLPLFPK